MAPITFANPAGFFALLAVPALVAIHCLREKARKFPASTLFLLPHAALASPRGTAWHRLQNSLAFWLQLLALLLLCWILLQPRWLSLGSWRQVTLLLDDSASMRACQKRVLAELPAKLRPLLRSTVPTEWTVLAASAPSNPLYRGTDAQKALASLSRWDPLLPDADPARVLASLPLASPQSRPIRLWISDRLPETIPPGITPLAFGSPLPNCGWVGCRVWIENDTPHWEALVRNASPSPQTRQWWWQDPRGRSEPASLTLQPGEIRTLRGTFPENTPRGTLHLSEDDFPFDDPLPVVRPQPRPLRIHCALPDPTHSLVQRVAATLPGARLVPDGPSDLHVGFSEANALPSLVFPPQTQPAPAELVFAENHPLVSDAGWESLVATDSGNLTPSEQDEPLVWRGSRPLVWLSPHPSAPRLVFNFHLENSNAPRLPAMVLLLSRFLGQIQSQLPGTSAANFATGESLPIPIGHGWTLRGESLPALTLPSKLSARAPLRPGGFSVHSESGAIQLEGAAQFLNPLESDFGQAGSGGEVLSLAQALDAAQTLPDPYTEVWLSLAGAALFAAWVSIAARENRPSQTPDAL
jgi:hypothetical protein